MKDRFQNLRSKVSGRVAIAAVLGAVGLGAAGTALAADKDSEKGATSAPSIEAVPAMPMHGGPPEVGLAIGFAGPGPGGAGEGDFAQELSDHLDGVSADEISTALDEIADEHEADRRNEMAESIAAELDGVDADEIADALQVAEDEMRAAFEDGDMPDPDLFAQTLADELGVSKDDVTKALEASREKAFEAHSAGAPSAPPVGGPGGPGMPGGFGPPPGADGDFTLPATPAMPTLPPQEDPGSGSGGGNSN